MSQPADPVASMLDSRAYPPRGGSASVSLPVAGGSARPTRERPARQNPARANLTRLLAVMFVVRGVLSISDAVSLAGDGLRPLPIVGPMAFSAVSPLWSILWALLAIAAGVAIGRRWTVGWLLGGAVAVAYLVSGVADLSLLDWSAAALQPDRLYAIAVDLLVPAAALALLSTTRHGNVRPRPVRRRRTPEPAALLEPALERWRRK